MGFRSDVSGEKMTVGIVDIGIGNIGSLSNALYIQGWDPVLLSLANDFNNISHVITR